MAKPSLEDTVTAAETFLAGTSRTFDDANQLWRDCRAHDQLTLARGVLSAMLHKKGALHGPLQRDKAVLDELHTDEAQLISKDVEWAASLRHDLALDGLEERFGSLTNPALDGERELLGVAGGICKRRWQDLGQLADLKRAATFYERGARARPGEEEDVGVDAYCHINAAFLNDVLASLGEDPVICIERARNLRERILGALPGLETVDAKKRWWNAASRAEALFGLGQIPEATQAILAADPSKAERWELQTTMHQLGHLAQLRYADPLGVPEVKAFFEAIFPGNSAAVISSLIGKVGLALSGGGFRASLYHLGVLAQLAERDMLRHLSVLSCVSGGSIVGACYWLALRRRLLSDAAPMRREDYIALVQEVIEHFCTGVDRDLRKQIQPSKLKAAWRLLKEDELGALDPEDGAKQMHECFYAPLMGDLGRTLEEPIYMHDLEFKPRDHVQAHGDKLPFRPGQDNWLRHDKVPVLVINATTLNTGHAWQFTPTWMGESPWAIHESADSIPRLEWSRYGKDGKTWKVELARAVAASACVPGIFAPVKLDGGYTSGVNLRLVDGGVHDNQGTVAMLAQDCNVVLVSDACGQLTLENDTAPGIKGLAAYGNRTLNIVMERVRLANFADLVARRQSGLLRSLMFLHMKAGLDADVVRRTDSQESYEIERNVMSSSGVRKDLQRALAELRTDLDAFTPDERNALMACGYRMASYAIERDLHAASGFVTKPPAERPEWPFDAILGDLTDAGSSTDRRRQLLTDFARGRKVVL
ncbi:patatin-like phospholipase family protein [Variovorax sp. J22R133]|uniref:patatin-like phospholipase family protein n=1 Tax=Variovorax brevis TaxID=3053503 RepID=UPI00257682E6|nr:patatin-like phospholipase family protein [Variovorax sp. J22R133]MDM0110669.1 patatin-like phospholipase family protein [Variovorax sp. J22R133]